MKRAGQVVLFRFPQTNLIAGKPRPAVLIAKLPGQRDDWLVCMVTSKTHQFLQDFDEVVNEDDADFSESGLKVPSVIRVRRLAVVDGAILLGATGEIAVARLQRIKERLVAWIRQPSQ